MFLNESIQANLYKLTDVLPKQLETKKCRCEHHQHPNELIVGPFKAHLSIAPARSLPFNLQMTVSPNAVLPSIKLGHEYTRGAEEPATSCSSTCPNYRGLSSRTHSAAGQPGAGGRADAPGRPTQAGHEHQMSASLFIATKLPSSLQIRICCHFQALPRAPPSCRVAALAAG